MTDSSLAYYLILDHGRYRLTGWISKNYIDFNEKYGCKIIKSYSREPAMVDVLLDIKIYENN